jgi:serpin B
MKKFVFYFVMLCLLAVVGACNKENGPEEIAPTVDTFEPIILSAKQSEKVYSDNRFAFTMFRNILKGPENNNPENNTFFSPLSLNIALGMLYNGASGDTRAEMADALYLSGWSETEVNEYYKKMSEALLHIDPLTAIGIANSIWYRNGFPVKQPFLDINQLYFDAQVRSLDFSDPVAADIINAWCAEKTNGKIKEIIEAPIPEDIVMYLINALYFKSKWQFEFDKANSRQDNFTTTAGTTIPVTLMGQTATLPYYADEHVQCVEMPYGNQAFSMVAILPQSNRTIDDLTDYLDNDVWTDISGKLSPQNVLLRLPRFKIECEMNLNKPVMDAGMRLIFSGGFDHISDIPLAVSFIKQKTFVEVNEEGTEAAAVTVTGIYTESGGSGSSSSFIANRPFLYMIKEKSTGTILFIGRMDEPKE